MVLEAFTLEEMTSLRKQLTAPYGVSIDRLVILAVLRGSSIVRLLLLSDPFGDAAVRHGLFWACVLAYRAVRRASSLGLAGAET
jgi:hypothetical protein